MRSIASPTEARSDSELGDMLRYWRKQRGKSQLDLSLDAGISQRHLSRVESGRSDPSREMLLALSEALDVPLRERNLLLLAAGYAPRYSEGAWNDPEMALVSTAIDRVLKQQEPHPALLMDRYWNVLKTNEAAPRFFGSFIDLSAQRSPRNLLHLVFDPAAMRPFVEQWEQVAAGLLARVHREAVGHVLDKRTLELLEDLKRYPGANNLPSVALSQSAVLPITFVKGSARSSYFSLITTVGTPQSVAAQELRIECMYPVEATPPLRASTHTPPAAAGRSAPARDPQRR